MMELRDAYLDARQVAPVGVHHNADTDNRKQHFNSEPKIWLNGQQHQH